MRTAHDNRWRPWAALFTLCAATALLAAPLAYAQVSTVEVVRVQEDWELVVGEADTNREAPQVICVISPFTHDDSLYACFELNHQSLPSYQQGGLQLQVWNGEQLVGYKDDSRSDLLGTQGEVVTWTQEMTVDQGSLRFTILNGNSTTWGQFAPDGTLRIVGGLQLANLNTYSPDYSVANSGVGFAANRVQSLTLKRVRLYTKNGEVLEDSTPRSVTLSQ